MSSARQSRGSTWTASGDGKWGAGDSQYAFGLSGDLPVAGDWNKDGITEIGVFARQSRDSTWIHQVTANGAAAIRQYAFGLIEDLPVAGDWNNDGKTEIGVFRPSKQRFYLDTSGDGRWGAGDSMYAFGLNGDCRRQPVTGIMMGRPRSGCSARQSRDSTSIATGDGKWGAGDSSMHSGLPRTCPWLAYGDNKSSDFFLFSWCVIEQQSGESGEPE